MIQPRINSIYNDLGTKAKHGKQEGIIIIGEHDTIQPFRVWYKGWIVRFCRTKTEAKYWLDACLHGELENLYKGNINNLPRGK